MYSITLHNGNVAVFTSAARFNARPSLQSNGSYADGNLYRVSFERSTSGISLSVTAVATGAGPPPLLLNDSLSVLEEGTAMYFGGVNVTE